MKSYSEKLKDPRWQKKRLLILQRDNFTCCNCGSKEKTLHVHHKLYYANTEPWDYNDNVLITLCFECHEQEQYNESEFKGLIHDLLLMGVSYSDLHRHLYNSQDSLTRLYPPYHG